MNGGKDGQRARQDDDRRPDSGVTAYRSSSDRVVFVENGNPEGWLSTDAVVDCCR